MLTKILENIELFSCVLHMIIMIFATMILAFGICFASCFEYGTGSYVTTTFFIMFSIILAGTCVLGAVGMTRKQRITTIVFIILVPMLLVYAALVFYMLIGTQNLRDSILEPYNIFLLHTVEVNYECCGFNGVRDYQNNKTIFTNHCCNLRDISNADNHAICESIAEKRPSCRDVILDGLLLFADAMIFFLSCTVILLILSWILAIIALKRLHNQTLEALDEAQ